MYQRERHRELCQDLIRITKLTSSEFPEPEDGMIPVALGSTVNLLSLLLKASEPVYESFSVFYPKVLSCFKITSHSLLTTLSFLEALILLINYIPKGSIFDAHAVLGQRPFDPFSYPEEPFLFAKYPGTG